MRIGYSPILIFRFLMNQLFEPYSVYTFVLLGFCLGFPLMLIRRKKNEKFSYLFVLSLVFSLVGIVSVLIFGTLEKIVEGKGFSVGAVSTYGLYLIGPFFLLLFKNRKQVFDGYACYVLPSLFLQRIRCIHSGCCQGTLIGSTGMRYPVREAEMVFYIGMLLFFLWKEKHSDIREGSLFPILMMSYGTFRFIEEFVREGTGLFHLAHVWSVLTILLGYSIYKELAKTKRSRG